MRVHELAKELDQSSKDTIEELKELGFEVKGHMSVLTDEEVAQVREMLFGDADLPSQVEAAPEPEPEAPAEETVEAEAEETPAVEEAPVAEKTEAPAVEETAPAEEEPPAPAEKAEILIKGNGIIVKDFAEALEVRPNQLIAELMGMNIFASINQEITLDIARQIGEKHGVEIASERERKKEEDKRQAVIQEAKRAKEAEEKKKVEAAKQATEAKPRPPVVTFLGHVDHGKTSLVDRIRNSRVAKGEAGGITQHIGAYTTEHKGKEITFLDTPGHAAFTKMRARGADLTDIAIIVIAADAGIQPQTKEAIAHAQAANVTLMVALNKMDLPAANPDNVKTQLQQEGLLTEDWGGDTICVPVSAMTGDGIDDLMEYINLQSEILELSAKQTGAAEGYVIEAQLEKGRGPTATVLVTQGTLKVGDSIVCGTAWGRVKALIDDQNKNTKAASPSHAAKVMGLSEVPSAGEKFTVVKNDKVARAEAEALAAELRDEDLNAGSSTPTSIEALLAQTAPVQHEELNMIIKTDAQGSLEAIKHTLNEIESEKVKIKFVLSGIGTVNENDIILASASNAMVVAFHVTTEGNAKKVAKREGVDIRDYSIIYELVDDVKLAMEGLLSPEFKHNVTGKAEIRAVFNLGNKKGSIAGCMVVDGKIQSNGHARLLRKKELVWEGKLSSLKRFQDDAKMVRDGQECGIGLEKFSKLEVGDIIEVYQIEELARQL